MSFSSLLNSAGEEIQCRVALATQGDDYLDRYIVFMRRTPGAPAKFPLTKNKILAYLAFMKASGNQYGTIRNANSSFSDYFKKRNDVDLTKEPRIRNFMTTNRRIMKGDAKPNGLTHFHKALKAPFLFKIHQSRKGPNCCIRKKLPKKCEKMDQIHK